MAPAAGYGLLNLLVPDTTMDWQQRATRRRAEGDPRREVGLWVGRLIGATDSDDPVATKRGRRRVRLFGVAEIAIACVLTALFWRAAA